MLKKFAFVLAVIVAASTFVGCNKEDDTTYSTDFTYSSTQIKGFSLQANKKVLASLDTVFFSIDLVNARIFNADSLPVGTNVSKLLANITTDNCRSVEILMTTLAGNDTVINYLTNSTDSINFNSPVKIRLASYDGKATRDYMVQVNVHKVQPDSLYWNRMAMRSLPTTFANPLAQKAVRIADKAVCITSDGSAYCIATTSDPSADEWTQTAVDFGFTPDVKSLTASTEALFILSADGALHTSADLGKTWAATGETGWTHIYGAFGKSVLGVRNGNTHVSYPASLQAPVPAGCPVKATSALVEVSNRWSETPQAVFVGGELDNGDASNSVWGFDGNSWAKLSDRFPAKVKDATLLPYRVAETDTALWKTVERPVLLSIGGLTEAGAQKTVYISRDMGMNWKKASRLLQLPDYIDARYGAQALIFNTLMTDSRGTSVWTPYPDAQLPGWWVPAAAESRAVAPITEWECPYIYIFGGCNADNALYNQIWRGVINRLTFKPLQ